MRLEYSEKASPLQVKLFSNASIKLSMEFTGMLKYLEDSPNLDLCVSEKIVTIRHINKKILAKKLTSAATTGLRQRRTQKKYI